MPPYASPCEEDGDDTTAASDYLNKFSILDDSDTGDKIPVGDTNEIVENLSAAFEEANIIQRVKELVCGENGLPMDCNNMNIIQVWQFLNLCKDMLGLDNDFARIAFHKKITGAKLCSLTEQKFKQTFDNHPDVYPVRNYLTSWQSVESTEVASQSGFIQLNEQTHDSQSDCIPSTEHAQLKAEQIEVDQSPTACTHHNVKPFIKSIADNSELEKVTSHSQNHAKFEGSLKQTNINLEPHSGSDGVSSDSDYESTSENETAVTVRELEVNYKLPSPASSQSVRRKRGRPRKERPLGGRKKKKVPTATLR